MSLSGAVAQALWILQERKLLSELGDLCLVTKSQFVECCVIVSYHRQKYTTMRPGENPPEPASALSAPSLNICCVWRRIYDGVLLWILSSYYLNGLALWWQSLWKSAKSESRLLLRLLKSLTHSTQRRLRKSKGPQQMLGERVFKHFIFKTFRLGWPHSYSYIERDRERSSWMHSSL